MPGQKTLTQMCVCVCHNRDIPTINMILNMEVVPSVSLKLHTHTPVCAIVTRHHKTLLLEGHEHDLHNEELLIMAHGKCQE